MLLKFLTRGVIILMWLTSVRCYDRVEDIYSQELSEPGYYLVATIPQGSTSINVTSLNMAKNFLAIKLHNASYILNGGYYIRNSGMYNGAGTVFVYNRRSDSSKENFYSAGPLKEAIDVMVVYQEPLVKIYFHYDLPADSWPLNYYDARLLQPPGVWTSIPPEVSTVTENVMLGDEINQINTEINMKRKKKRLFAWRAVDFTKCSKPCGGGYQHKRYICIRLRTQSQVSDGKCHRLEKPHSTSVRCNTMPCDPAWDTSSWGPCSVSCGNGTQNRIIRCIQELPDSLTAQVPSEQCKMPIPITFPQSRACYMTDCQAYKSAASIVERPRQFRAKWEVGSWSECSVPCGGGKRKRIVTCHTSGRACNRHERPESEEDCNSQSCEKSELTSNSVDENFPEIPYLYSNWPEKCPADCGIGTMTRKLFCLKNDSCSEASMPTSTQTCVGDEKCKGQWFSGPWSRCSISCDRGIKTREVICVSQLINAFRVIKDHHCHGVKPDKVIDCNGPPCNSSWFVSDWSKCSKSCGVGYQNRIVRCISADGMDIIKDENQCNLSKKPTNRQECFKIPCESYSTTEENNSVPDSTNRTLRENQCKDWLSECHLLRHKSEETRKQCAMDYYKKECCKACRYNYFLHEKFKY